MIQKETEKGIQASLIHKEISKQEEKQEEIDFLIKERIIDELEQDQKEDQSKQGQIKPTDPQNSNRLAIIELSKNLKPKRQESEEEVLIEHSQETPLINSQPAVSDLKADMPSNDVESNIELDPLDEFMAQIKNEAVEQESFNFNAVLNNYLPIDQRKEDEGGLEIDHQELEKEKNIFTQEELNKLMGQTSQKTNDVSQSSEAFNKPRVPGVEEAEEDASSNISEEEAYNSDDQAFVEALKNSNLLFDEIEEESKSVEKVVSKKEKSESEDEFCGDTEVAEQEILEEKLKKAGGMESSSKGIDMIRNSYLEKKKNLERKKILQRVDHSNVIYESIRKDLYIECNELEIMTEDEVAQKRRVLGDIKIRGLNPVRPLFSWYHCGLPKKVLSLLVDKLNYKEPFPIQCQCIPVIMSGRDCIGIAETGSGKTLAYVLPMIRHIKSQKPLGENDGPIALILVPTRELATQVFSTVKLIGKALGLRAAAVFGGTSLSSQFSELKKGVEVVVSTPGRLIDILTTSNGRITNLKRVTYVVLDEADRMFDLGFEPQINRIIGNVRPSRQTVMFSATFPRNVEYLAKRILNKPLEVVVGIRGQACKNVQQTIEIIEEDRKIFRLLELLGIWLDKGSVIVFIDRQADGDQLYQDLIKYKYIPLLLHGGQDQDDRVNTLREFKKQSKKVLITTSLGARGLDIKSVILVINYNCPSFKEDYTHRIGRTGRAGRKGYAFTMITTDEDKYAGDLIQALQISNSEVPQSLLELHQKFREKVQRGEAKDFKNRFLGERFKI